MSDAAANLGTPPFSIEYRRHDDQPVECRRCGKMIKHEYQTTSADGIVSSLGSECVRLVADAATIENAIGEAASTATAEREAVVQLASALIGETANGQRLSEIPHPRQYFADQGKTYLDYWKFVQKNGGLKKRASVAQHVLDLID